MGPEHVQVTPGRNRWGGVWGVGGQLPVLAPAASELLGAWLLYTWPPRAEGTEDGWGLQVAKQVSSSSLVPCLF